MPSACMGSRVFEDGVIHLQTVLRTEALQRAQLSCRSCLCSFFHPGQVSHMGCEDTPLSIEESPSRIHPRNSNFFLKKKVLDQKFTRNLSFYPQGLAQHTGS